MNGENELNSIPEKFRRELALLPTWRDDWHELASLELLQFIATPAGQKLLQAQVENELLIREKVIEGEAEIGFAARLRTAFEKIEANSDDLSVIDSACLAQTQTRTSSSAPECEVVSSAQNLELAKSSGASKSEDRVGARSKSRFSRRNFLIGGGALAIAAAAIPFLIRKDAPRVDPNPTSLARNGLNWQKLLPQTTWSDAAVDSEINSRVTEFTRLKPTRTGLLKVSKEETVTVVELTDVSVKVNQSQAYLFLVPLKELTLSQRRLPDRYDYRDGNVYSGVAWNENSAAILVVSGVENDYRLALPKHSVIS